MPRLQYPNPNKPFKLFMDASKHSYLGILNQEEVSNQPKAEPNLVPIVYFFGSFSKTSLLVHSKLFTLLSRHIMHTLLQPQTACSILHHWYVQPSTPPLSFGTAAA